MSRVVAICATALLVHATAAHAEPGDAAVPRAVGGLYAGGYLGAVIEGDRCNCDDPGLMGALIGAPIGAVVGGIVGLKLF